MAQNAAMQIMMTQLPSLSPVAGQNLPTAEKENLLARDVLEHAVLLSIRLKDEESFDRNYLQLETFYFDKCHITVRCLA